MQDAQQEHGRKPHFHGRRRGRKLRSNMQRLLDERLDGLRFDAALPLAAQFAHGPTELFLEIGFGGGENLAAMAMARPEAGFLGAEPFVNGVASLIRHIDDMDLGNVRIWDDDVRLIMGGIADAELAGASVLFPDPWPKRRHARRRILGGGVLGELTRLVRPGGFVVLASDHPVAKGWLLEAAMAHDALEWTARGPDDWRRMPDGLVATRYMKKAEREQRTASWFVFRRR